MRYFITFACYGVHLHGDESGSADRNHHVYDDRLAEASPDRVAAMRNQMDQLPYFLDKKSRGAVVNAFREVCLHPGWSLRAAHVRSNHVHNISRHLSRLGIDAPERKRWARHGSTRWLREDKDVQEAIRYVISEQGEPRKFTWESCYNLPLLYSRGSSELPSATDIIPLR